MFYIHHLHAGVILFCTGMFINLQADHILRNLRKPGETGYKIPRGTCILFVFLLFVHIKLFLIEINRFRLLLQQQKKRKTYENVITFVWKLIEINLQCMSSISLYTIYKYIYIDTCIYKDSVS